MNWFTRVRNNISWLPKRTTDKDLWVKCPSCQQMVFAQEYEDNAFVCPRCDHHGRIGADERLRQLLDVRPLNSGAVVELVVQIEHQTLLVLGSGLRFHLRLGELGCHC